MCARPESSSEVATSIADLDLSSANSRYLSKFQRARDAIMTHMYDGVLCSVPPMLPKAARMVGT